MLRRHRWPLLLLPALALAGCRDTAPEAEAAEVAVAEEFSPPPEPTPPPLPDPETISHEGLPNFAVFTETVYRGGAPSTEGFQNLQKMGITTIIDLRIEKARHEEQKEAEALGFHYLSIPLGKEAPTEAQTKTFLETLANADAEPVYFHCQHGADRTGAMGGIYRATVQGWSFDEIWPEMQKYGFKPWLDELKGAVQQAAAGNTGQAAPPAAETPAGEAPAGEAVGG